MKRLIFLSFFLVPLLLQAQVDVLIPPSEPEKTELSRILKEYEKFIIANGDTSLSKEKKAMALLKFSKDIYNNDVQFYSDLDTTQAVNDFLRIFQYVKKFNEVYKGILVNIHLTDIVYSKVKYDKIRKYHFVEATANKNLEWSIIQPRKAVDTTKVEDNSVADTINYALAKRQVFYIRFEKANGISKNFKLLAVSKAGLEPKLEPLPTNVIWWLELDQEWKTFFREKLKLQEYPTSYEVERVTGFQELDLSNKKFSTLDPLKKMPFLRKLNCSNTPITNLEAISEVGSLSELDISKTQIKNLNGIEKLVNLTDLKCPALKLESIEPLKNLINLLKLDCSENELEDVSPLKDLVNLKELDFSLNIKVKSIEPIKNLVALEKLSFSKINAQNLEPLRSMINLVYLNCYNANITSLEPIRNLKKIMFLDIDHDKITSLEPIKDYQFLTQLRLSSTNIVDLSYLKNYRFLREVDISNNPQINNLGPIHQLESIKVLKCFYTKVSKDEVARFKKNHPNCQITYYY